MHSFNVYLKVSILLLHSIIFNSIVLTSKAITVWIFFLQLSEKMPWRVSNIKHLTKIVNFICIKLHGSIVVGLI